MTDLCDGSRLLTIDDLARILGKPKATIYQWRSRGVGPPGYRIGNTIRWKCREVLAWIDGQADDWVSGAP